MDTRALRQTIEAAPADGRTLDPELRAAVEEVMARLDRGELRVAEPQGDTWVTHAWLKQAILLYFAMADMHLLKVEPFTFHDKIPLKRDVQAQGVRLVPPGTIRYGAFLEPGAVVMPAYVNIGAYVGARTMVDTWATIGSCAQIGRDVHVSGGVGIGGVLEPLQATPVIVEDGVFLGSRCVVVEGVHIGSQAVIGAGVVLTASTPIIDVTGATERVYKGAVPRRSVVIPGTRPKQFPAGTYHLPCALIVGERQPGTDLKTSLNQVLRQFHIPT